MKWQLLHTILGLAATLPLLALCGCHKPTEPPAPTYAELSAGVEYATLLPTPMKLSDISLKNCWQSSGDTLISPADSSISRYTLSQITVSPTQSFSLSCDLTFTSSSSEAAGLVFGVKNPLNPSVGHYGVNIDRKAGLTRLFSTNVGTVGYHSSAQRYLSEEETRQSTFHLDLYIYAGGYFRFSLNGEQVGEYYDPTYQGGPIGFMTDKANATFSNIQYRVVDSGALSEVEVLDASEKGLYDESVGFYRVSYPHDTESILCRLTGKEGDVLYVDGKRYPDTTLPVKLPLTSDLTVFDVVRVGADGEARYTTLAVYRDANPEEIYADPFRPQYHFTPQVNYMNDPNGLVYNALTGEYHLYYQYSPLDYDAKSKIKVWGHAVSTDMVHWEQKKLALDADNIGKIFSGCCVVDKDNTSGFFDDTTPPEARFVAVYSYDSAKQAIAYSPDGGYTWKKYEGNPVIPHYTLTPDFRDPKVQWMEESGLWLMIIGGGRHALYTSPDLKTWTLNSAISDIEGKPVEGECPDLFRLPLDDDENNQKWVVFGGSRFYIVGDLVRGDDGMYRFIATEPKRTDYNACTNSYAGTSFYNDKLGRRILMAWFVDNSASTTENKNWNGMQTLPYETKLRSFNGVSRLVSYPIAELSTLEGKVLLEKTEGKLFIGNALGDVTPGPMKIELCFTPTVDNGVVTFLLSESEGTTTLTYDIEKKSLQLKTVRGTYTIPLTPAEDGSVSIDIFLDRSLVEIFGNKGDSVISAVTHEDLLDATVSLRSTTACQLSLLRVTEMGAFFR